MKFVRLELGLKTHCTANFALPVTSAWVVPPQEPRRTLPLKTVTSALKVTIAPQVVVRLHRVPQVASTTRLEVKQSTLVSAAQ